tara:strand:- start:388 stop:858 length:471 start_codon:yes stop_codon:yes gene_type:complete
MIIICPSCQKRFDVDSNLIPEKGRVVKCGSCNHTWVFNKNDKNNIEIESIEIPINNQKNRNPSKSLKKNITSNNNLSDLSKSNKGSELIKYQAKSNFSFVKILNYLIVLLISFAGIIIVLDTFKSPLSVLFPNLELLLYSLFETLKDLVLFIKDLN